MAENTDGLICQNSAKLEHQDRVWNNRYEIKDHLQGGALLYTNSDKTSHANSKYRILNRTPTNQTGTPKYFIDKSMVVMSSC